MLSVLSSTTINLSEELHRTRQDLVSARLEAAGLADALARKRTGVAQHLDSFWAVLQYQHGRVLKSKVFHAFSVACHHWHLRRISQALQPPSSPRSPKSPKSRAKSRWLWEKKVFGTWRRATALAQRLRTQESHQEQLEEHRGSILELREHVDRLHGRRVDTDALLLKERTRVQELEKELSSCKEQVGELQRTLKQCYVQQFEDSQKRDELEGHFSKLAEDFRQMKAEKENLQKELLRTKEELEESKYQCASREERLEEQASELSLAEDVIADITTSKLIGLQRFFDHYDSWINIKSLSFFSDGSSHEPTVVCFFPFLQV